jgi:hypothetical protein
MAPMKPVAERTNIPQRKRKPGEAPLHRIPIFDKAGNQIAHVGHTATAATVARFTNTPGARLGTKNGRRAWLA